MTSINKHSSERLKAKLAVVLLVSQSFIFMFSGTAHAGTLTDTYVRLTRMKAGQASNIRVVLKVPAGNSGTEEKVKISLADNFTVATSGITTATAACATDTGATALPGTLTITSSNGAGVKHVTVSGVTNLSASTTYCVDIETSPLTSTGSVGGYATTVETQTSGAALIDSTSVTLRIITDDQIVVSATVPPSFTFAIDANTTSFTSNLDSGSIVSTTGRTVTITTNASKGWVAWVKDLNAGLTSAAASKTINTSGTVNGAPTTLSTGAEGYVLDVDLTTDFAGGGTVTIAAEYNGGANAGGTLDSSTFQPIASSNGTAGGTGDVVTLVGKAGIAGDTPAATDYTDTWTVIGAGVY